MNTAQQDLPPPAPNTAEDWKAVLHGERERPYFQELLSFIERERSSGKIVYPKNAEVFNALHFTPFDIVKVIIVGQDPYHGPNQAQGLCFSVKPGIAPPPSLLNILKEIKSDLKIDFDPRFGSLEKWARQGVLLLNAVLTVEASKASSHANKGWEQFTDRIIQELNARKDHLVFLLWGSYAQKKCFAIDRTRHLVLEAPHPSPLSASRGFLGCKHFSQTNHYLAQHGIQPIDWSLG